MPDVVQIVLALTIVILTALLTVLGIEVFYILKDLRRILDRATNVLLDAEQVVQNVKKPTEVVASLTHSADILSHLYQVVKKQEISQPQEAPVAKEQPQIIVVEQAYEPPVEQESPRIIVQEQSPQSSLTVNRRFFRSPRRTAS